MVHRGSISILALACGVLMGPASLRGEDSQVRVELSCKITAETGLTTGRTLLVEIQDPGGETISKAFAHAGQYVRFRRLKPGIVVACVKDRSGGYRCESVDLYPPPSARVARFSVELKPPVPAPQAERLHMVSKSDLVIPEKARREFGKCMEERRNGNIAGALRHLERALDIHPEYPEALTNLGAAYHLAGDYVRAIQLFEQVTEIAPEMYAGWLNLGVTLLVSGDAHRALQAEMRALTLRPDDPFVLYQVGLCYYMLAEFGAARRYLRRVIELDPCSATYPHVYLARIALAENQPDEAKSLIRQVLELHPHSPWPPGMKEVVERINNGVMVSGYPFPN